MNTTPGLSAQPKCPYCGMLHGPLCFMVKVLEYHEDGSLKRVEFKTAADYPQAIVLPSVTQPTAFPHSVFPQTTCGAQ